MNRIIFASNNPKKIEEVRTILGNAFDVKSLKDINFTDEIPEPFDTIKENSIYKAKFFEGQTGTPCIAEDSGLEVEALNGKPGAYSARYAGDGRNDVLNYQKLLTELEGIEHRQAQFISVITYIHQGEIQVFEGLMKGKIASEAKGSNGFGYDPVFIADGCTCTNAELTSKEKNKISHRRKALDKLSLFFSSNTPQE